ncbi:MAG: type IX secretion system PorP/SprF family membrane protein [Glaciecola sp.]|jgi:type IX secretion system PorP/SprF family membrane protein
MGKDSSNLAYITHRNQWPAVQEEYLSTNFGYHHYLSKTNGFVGLNGQHDVVDNTYSNSSLSLNYSQNIKVKTSLFKIGGKASFVQNTSQFSNRSISEQRDQQLGYLQPAEDWQSNEVIVKKFIDFSVGLSFYRNGFTVGAAAHHIINPIDLSEQITNPLRRRITVQLAKSFTSKIKSHELEISPYVMYRYQRFFESIQIGVLGSYHWAVFGLSNRVDNDINFTGGVKTKYFNVLYSYDHPISSIAQNFGGAHEISLQFHPFKKRKKGHKNLMSVKSPFML